jgi:putative hydrolase
MHSTWSDGSQTLEALVSGCAARGYGYAAVTDHSAGLPIAGGLSLDRLRAQGVEIERLNRAHSVFRLLRGVEANIRGDGSVDVEPADRRRLDVVVAAPHSGLRTATAQTERMITAACSPGVHVLGHPRGRMYGSRPGVAADWRQVFDVAARHGVAIELDGDPSRQDADYELAQVALESGCLFALDSDAHAVDQLWYAEIAMAHAAVAGIPAERIVNTWTLDELLAWADRRQRG